MVGHLHGDVAMQWVRAEFGPDAVRRVEQLQPRQWTCCLGHDPRR
jgi:hypothetical protein